MSEIVYDFGTEETFIAVAKAWNLWREATDDEPGGPVVYGTNWFFNVVGPQPEYAIGYGARLRWLRDDPVPPTPEGVTEYTDPETQPPIGMIA